MRKARKLDKFALYGENPGALTPEFLHIEPISARSSLHEWTISPHTHPNIHQFLILVTGAGVLVADGAHSPLAPRSLIAVPSQCVHAFRFDPGSEGWVFSFTIDLLHDHRLARPLRDEGFPLRDATLATANPDNRDFERLCWLMEDLNADLASGNPAGLTLRLVTQFGLVLATAENIFRRDGKRPQTSRPRDLAGEFRILVNRDFRSGRDVTSYARALGTTVPTLNRACRADLGRPAGAVIRDRLLLEAFRHLTFTSASISQISGRLGFSDPAYFARFFKQRTGKSASQFREEGGWFDTQAAEMKSDQREGAG